MRPDVRARFVDFTARFEGVVPFMYLDVKGLVTTAVGNLIDPIDAALPLPWRRLDGTPATPAEVATDWLTVKGHTEMELWGGGHFASVTKLRLDADGILATVARRLGQMDLSLAKRYGTAFWEALPADAQLAVLSMSWAAGPGFVAPHFDAALRSSLWEVCAAECHLDDTHNPGLKSRNAANKELFLALQTSEQQKLALPVQEGDGPAAYDTGPC